MGRFTTKYPKHNPAPARANLRDGRTYRVPCREPVTRPKTLYAVLGKPPGSSFEELHEAFKALAIEHHPDKVSGNNPVAVARQTARFAEITAAYAILKDAKMRATYDKQLAMLGRGCKSCAGTGLKLRTKGFARASKIVCPACEGTGQEVA